MQTLSYIVIAYLNVRSVTRRSSSFCFLGIWIMFIETEDQIYVALLHLFGVYYCCLLRHKIKYCTFSLYFFLILLICVVLRWRVIFLLTRQHHVLAWCKIKKARHKGSRINFLWTSLAKQRKVSNLPRAGYNFCLFVNFEKAPYLYISYASTRFVNHT